MLTVFNQENRSTDMDKVKEILGKLRSYIIQSSVTISSSLAGWGELKTGYLNQTEGIHHKFWIFSLFSQFFLFSFDFFSFLSFFLFFLNNSLFLLKFNVLKATFWSEKDIWMTKKPSKFINTGKNLKFRFSWTSFYR